MPRGSPTSPRLARAGIVTMDPDISAVQHVIALQYNPDSLTRTLQIQAVVGGQRGVRVDALRLGFGSQEAFAAQCCRRQYPQYRIESRVPCRRIQDAREYGTPAGGRPAGGPKIERPLSEVENPAVGMSRIRMTIDQLVSRGFEAGERKALVDGLRGELSRVLADPATRAEWSRPRRTPVLRLGAMPLEPGLAGGRKFCGAVARAVGGGLKP